MRKNSSGFAQILMVVLLLIGLGSLGLYYISARQKTPTLSLPTPSSIPTSNSSSTLEATVNWKVYENKKYGYQIKYPPLLNPRKDDNDNYLDFISFYGNDKSYTPYSIYLRQTKLEEEVGIVRAQTEGHVLANLTKNEGAIIQGFPAHILEYVPESPEIGPVVTYIIINNEKYSYVITSPSAIFNQILSTFKFTN